MNYFENEGISESERLEQAICILVSIRDMLSLAMKADQRATYKQSLHFINDIAPEIYNPINKLISYSNKSYLIDYYKELAAAESKTPYGLVDREIKKLAKIVDHDPNKKEVKRQLEKLREVLPFLKDKLLGEKAVGETLSENRLLQRDYNLPREHYSELLTNENTFRDYKLNSNRILRLRLLHMEKAETVTGADLNYEQYDMKRGLVRFVFLQYKASENENLNVYFSQSRLGKQVEKLDKTFCGNDFCSPPKESTPINYRMPHCSAFVRPTRKVVTNSKVISSGIHIPVCVAKEVAKLHKMIGREEVRECSLSHEFFEEMFNANMLGSRWMPIKEVEQFYKEKKILEPDGAIKIYASEML